MLHVEDVFKQKDVLIYYYYYYYYLGCSACKLAQMHLCMCCVNVKLNMNRNYKWMFSMHCTYLSMRLKCLSSRDFNSNFFVKNNSKISKLIQFTPKSSKIWVKKWQNLSKKARRWWCFSHVVVNLNMNKIAISGGPIHGALFPFSKVVHLRNP
jgi:hypothetical protein